MDEMMRCRFREFPESRAWGSCELTRTGNRLRARAEVFGVAGLVEWYLMTRDGEPVCAQTSPASGRFVCDRGMAWFGTMPGTMVVLCDGKPCLYVGGDPQETVKRLHPVENVGDVVDRYLKRCPGSGNGGREAAACPRDEQSQTARAEETDSQGDDPREPRGPCRENPEEPTEAEGREGGLVEKAETVPDRVSPANESDPAPTEKTESADGLPEFEIPMPCTDGETEQENPLARDALIVNDCDGIPQPDSPQEDTCTLHREPCAEETPRDSSDETQRRDEPEGEDTEDPSREMRECPQEETEPAPGIPAGENDPEPLSEMQGDETDSDPREDADAFDTDPSEARSRSRQALPWALDEEGIREALEASAPVQPFPGLMAGAKFARVELGDVSGVDHYVVGAIPSGGERGCYLVGVPGEPFCLPKIPSDDFVHYLPSRTGTGYWVKYLLDTK